MKPKIKEILFDAFAVICVLVGFSIHSWPSLCFLLGGSICGSFALYFTLLNHRVHGVSESQARNWALVIFAVSIIGAILFWRECKQPTNLAESNPVAAPNATKEDIQELAALIKSKGASTNENDDVAHPGIGFYAILRLNGVVDGRPNYIFDWAESSASNRMSLYIQPDKTLCLRIIDQDSDQFSANVNPGFDTFSFHSLLYVVCEFGNAGNESFLRIMINGKTVAYKIYPELKDFHPDVLKMRRGEIASDIDKRNGSKITVETYALRSDTLDRKKRDIFMNLVFKLWVSVHPHEGGFTFNGDGSMTIADSSPILHPEGGWNFQPNLFSPTN